MCELGTAGASLVYVDVGVFRIDSEINGVRERSKGG